MRSHMMYGSSIITDVPISRFLRDIITDENINALLWQWNKAHVSSQMIYVGYNSSNFPCEDNILLAEFGKAKADKTKPQVIRDRIMIFPVNQRKGASICRYP